jgi:mannose-6-phosphate isomerase-like protein (cupin superfamily)
MAGSDIVVRGVADADVLGPADTAAGVRLARLITKAGTGSRVLVGVCWLNAGESTSFTLDAAPAPGESDPAQEVYFVVRGSITVSSSKQTLRAGEHDAVYFPPGDTYRVTGDGPGESLVLYTVAPAPR